MKFFKEHLFQYLKNGVRFFSDYLRLTYDAPNILSIVITLVLAGFLNIFGFLLLVPVIDSLLFGHIKLESNPFIVRLNFYLGVKLNFSEICSMAFMTLIGGFVLQAYGSFISYKSRFQLIRSWRDEFSKLHTKQTLEYISGKHSGNFNDLILNQTEQAGAGYYTIYSFWISVLQVITYIIVGLILSYQLTILIIIFFALIGIASSFLQLKTRKHSKYYTAGFQNLGLVVNDYNNNLKIFRVSKFLNEFIKNSMLQTRTIAQGLTSIYRLHISQTFILQTFSLIIIFAVISVREKFGLVDSMVLVFLATLKKIGGHLQDMLNNALAFQSYSASIELLQKEKTNMRQNLEKSGEIRSKDIKRINFNNVTFDYPRDKTIFSNVSFSIAKKETVVISGASGSGKSTLLDLILLFHQPAKGLVKINNINGESLDKIKYRERIAYIPQNVSLNYGTIRSNLTIDKEVNDSELRAACKFTNIYPWISTLKKGFDSTIGEKGINISGGQIQRLILARALIQKPEILIMDESTSALDQVNERKINNLLKKMAEDMTIIIVTHKIKDVDFANKYLTLKGGSLHEFSEYQDALDFVKGG